MQVVMALAAATLTAVCGAQPIDTPGAVADQPFAAFAPAFKSAVRVCDVLFLHLNVRSCQALLASAGDALVLTVGPKRDVAPGMVYRMVYSLRIEAEGPDYLRVSLRASSGPLATRDYRVVIEAMAR